MVIHVFKEVIAQFKKFSVSLWSVGGEYILEVTSIHKILLIPLEDSRDFDLFLLRVKSVEVQSA